MADHQGVPVPVDVSRMSWYDGVDAAMELHSDVIRRCNDALQQATGGNRTAGQSGYRFWLRFNEQVVAVYRPDPDGIVNPWHCYNVRTGEFIEARTDEAMSMSGDYHSVTVTP